MPEIRRVSPGDIDSVQLGPELSGALHSIERHDIPVQFACLLLYALSALLLFALIWAAVSVVPEVAQAPGQIIPEGNVRLIQTASDGTIERVLVKEGQRVQPGEPLVSLDKIPYEAEVNKAHQDLEIARSKLSEYEKAERALSSIVKDPAAMPPDQVEISNVSQAISDVYTSKVHRTEAAIDASTPDNLLAPVATRTDMSMLEERLSNLVSAQEQAKEGLAKRKVEFAMKQKSLAIETTSLNQQVSALHSQQSMLAQLVANTKQQQQAMQAVYQQGAISRMDYLEVLKTLESQELQLLAHNNEVTKTEHQLTEAQSAEVEFANKSSADLGQLQSEYKKLSAEISQVSMEVRARQRDLSLSDSSFRAALERAKALLSEERDEVAQQSARVEQCEAILKAAQDKLSQSALCAPVAGTVTSIKVTGKGQIVSHQETLMTIVPTITNLVVEARLPNKDVAFVSKGQDAKIKLEAFPFQDYGILAGKVTEIESYPREDATTGSYYRVLIRPEHSWVQVQGKQIPFAAGLTLTAEIVTRQRTILSIILEPINKLKEMKWN